MHKSALTIEISAKEAALQAELEAQQFERDKERHGTMRATLKRSRRKGYSAAELTVLSPQIDPFRLDTSTNHQNAKWFAEQVERFVGNGTVHLRGLHYKCNGNIWLPSGGISQGMPYINTDACWLFILAAAKAARWLGYIPFARIFDNRNDPPLIYVPEYSEPRVELHSGSSVEYDLPDEQDTIPRFVCDLKARQPYRIVFFGEKSSLSVVLRPIAEAIGAETVLCTGESSDTRIVEIAARADADGRPLVVLYFSDFDPSGWQMVISVSRKLQACKHLLYPNLNASVQQVALTIDQIKQFDLPETPLKESEKRADKWEAKFGRGQTEIDALLALYPESLREITMDAIKPFYDDTLRDRALEAWRNWDDAANAMLAQHPDYSEHQQKILEAYSGVTFWSEKLSTAQERAYEILSEVDPPQPIAPVAELTVLPPEPIFTTDEDYETASQKLIKRKRLIGD